MTGCEMTLVLLLDADVEALSGKGETEAAAHIRECSTCTAAARHLLAGIGHLDHSLASAPPIDLDALLARARKPESAGAETPTADERSAGGTAPHPRITPLRPLWGRRPWVALAAAATVVALFSVRLGRQELPEAVGGRLPALTPPLVEAGAGEHVAVIATDNPDITLLWFFGNGEG